MTDFGGWPSGRGLVILAHGAWVDAGSWSVWSELLDDNGYDAISLEWPGPTVTFTALVQRITAAVRSLDRPVILIGHGFGAVACLAMRDRSDVAATIAIAPVAGGVRGRLEHWKGFSHDGFRHRYAAAESSADAARLAERFAGPSRVKGWWPANPRRANPWPAGSGGRRVAPLLLISGGQDVLAPERHVERLERSARRRHRDAVSDLQVFPRSSHSLVLGSDAEDVAGYVLDWLSRQDL